MAGFSLFVGSLFMILDSVPRWFISGLTEVEFNYITFLPSFIAWFHSYSRMTSHRKKDQVNLKLSQAMP